MKKKTLMVTGASGFVGRNFIEKYKDEYNIIPVSLRNKSPKDLDYTNVDCILHLAALVHQMTGAPEEKYFEVNTELTKELAINAKKNGIKHFVFYSTVKVYGYDGDLYNHNYVIDENTECKPKDPYGESKYKAEEFLREIASDEFKVSCIRPPMIYGPGVKGNMINLVKLVKKFPILPFNYGENKRSIVSITNLLNITKEIIDKEKNGIVIPTDGEPVSIKEIVEGIAEALEKKIILVKFPKFIYKLMCKVKPKIMVRLYGSLQFKDGELQKLEKMGKEFKKMVKENSKVLFYTPFLSTGGLDKASVDYIKMFQKSKIEIEVIVDYNFGKRNYFETTLPKDTKYRFLKSKFISNYIYSLRTIGKKYRILNVLLYISVIIADFYYSFKLKKIIKKEKIKTTISFYQYLPSYLTQIKGTKNIIFLHGSVEYYFKGIKKHFKSNYLKKLKKYDYVITVSKDMEKEVNNLFPEIKNVQTIYNPMDFNEIRAKSKEDNTLTTKEKKLLEKKYICTVARIDEGQKDIKVLIDAYIKGVKSGKIKEELLYIVGTGPDLNNLKRYIKEVKMEERIKFLGMKKNPYIWIKNSELFVLSSKFEGFGLVILEALILNVPVVSSNCKVGPSEILENGKYGDLCEVGNINELKRLIIKNLKKEGQIDYEEALLRFDKEKEFLKLIKLIK